MNNEEQSKRAFLTITIDPSAIFVFGVLIGTILTAAAVFIARAAAQ